MIKDKTAMIPFVLFGAFAAFVIWVIIKNQPHYESNQTAEAQK